MTGIGLSPLRPNNACNKSVCSDLVGRPVEGPPRCTSSTTSGSSVMTARFIASDFRQTPGPEVEVTASAPAKRADRSGATGNLVFALHGHHAQRLVLGEFVQYIGCRSNGIGAEEQLQASLFSCGDETVSSCFVPRDIHVSAGNGSLTFNLICMGYGSMGVVSVVISCMDDLDICSGNFGLLANFSRMKSSAIFRSRLNSQHTRPTANILRHFSMDLLSIPVSARQSFTIFEMGRR